MSTTSSRNFTTLYSGSGSVVPQGAYGNANVVSLLAAGTDGGNTVTGISATGNITTTAQMSATGNITTAGYFVGNFAGNITGNLSVPGLNTEVLYNNSGNAGASADFTFNDSTNLLSVAGNVQANYFVGNGSLLTGVATSLPSGTTDQYLRYSGSAWTAATLDIANDPAPSLGGNLDASTYQIINAGNITSSANIAGSYFLGNGAFLTGISTGGSYGNANVANFLANYGSNTIVTTGNVDSGNLNATNVYVTGVVSAAGNVRGGNINTAGLVSATGNVQGANVIGAYLWGDGSNITGVVAGAHTVQFEVKNTSGGTLTRGTPVYVTGTVGSTTVLEVSASRADTAATMPAIGLLEQDLAVNATGSAISVGTLSSVNTSTYTIGQQIYVGATGGLSNARPTDSYVVQSIGSAGRINASTGSIQVNIWNIADLPNLGTGNIWVGNAGNIATQTVLATYTGNIGAGNISVTGNTTSGNLITGGNVNINGYVNFTGSAPGLVGGGQLVGFSGQPTYISSFDNGNTAGNAVVQADGANGIVNIIGAAATSPSTWTFTGSTGNLTLPGNSSAINYANGVNILTSATGTYGNSNVATFLAAFGSNTISTTGNITGGNLLTGNLVVAPGTGAGNIWIGSSQAPATVTTTVNPARVIIGNSYTGNADGWSINYDPYSRLRQSVLAVNQRVTRGEGNINFSGFTNVQQMELTANVTTGTLSRQFGGVNYLHVGGGANAYQSTVLNPAAFCGMNGVITAGTNGNIAVGNISLSSASGVIGAVNPNNGATIGNAFAMIGAMQVGGATSTITNAIAFAPYVLNLSGVAPTTVPTNYNVYYNPSATAAYGALTNTNSYRSAANYYAFKNDDDVAQVKLGSLRTYHEYQYSTATSGTVNIDKSNAQTQYIAPTANVTIGDFQNFVTTASNSVSSINQADTVTLIIKQGATPYTVSMPTGNASIKYANNVSTVGTTANSVTMISITGANVGGAALYLVTVSPEFV